MSYHLDAVQHADSYGDRLQQQADATEAAHASLMQDALDAFAGNADEPLRTPNACIGCYSSRLPQHTPAWDVFNDQLCNDRLSVHAILAAMNHCCQSSDPAVRLPAQAVLAKVARGYADTYADIVAEG